MLINGVPTAHDKIDPLSQAERGPNQKVTSLFLVPWIPRVPQNRKEAVSGDMGRPTKVVESRQQTIYLGDTAGLHPPQIELWIENYFE